MLAVPYLDIDGIVVHLMTVPVNLERHVLVLEVPVQLVLHTVVRLDLTVHLGIAYLKSP